jgi:hypothetical protein
VWWLCLATAAVAMEGEERPGRGHGLLGVDGSPRPLSRSLARWIAAACFRLRHGWVEQRAGRGGVVRFFSSCFSRR